MIYTTLAAIIAIEATVGGWGQLRELERMYGKEDESVIIREAMKDIKFTDERPEIDYDKMLSALKEILPPQKDFDEFKQQMAIFEAAYPPGSKERDQFLKDNLENLESAFAIVKTQYPDLEIENILKK